MTESAKQVAFVSDFQVARFDPPTVWRPRAGDSCRALAHAPYDDQRHSTLDAPYGYTTWAGAAVGKQSALTVGAGADLTNFGVDHVECPADDLVDNPVLVAVVDGEIVLRAI